MDHGSSMGHGASRCGMDMVWNWKTSDVCVVFEWWEIENTFHLLLSMVAVFVIALLSEHFSYLAGAYDIRLANELDCSTGGASPESGTSGARGERVPLVGMVRPSLSRGQQAVRAVVYALRGLVCYFLMLVAMTFNGFLVFSVIAGASLGFFLFHKDITTPRAVMCH